MRAMRPNNTINQESNLQNRLLTIYHKILTFIVKSTYDSDLQGGKIYLRNIVS